MRPGNRPDARTVPAPHFSHRVIAEGSQFHVVNQGYGVKIATYSSRDRANRQARSLNVQPEIAMTALVASIGQPLGRWHGVLATEGEWTGDDRFMEAGSLVWDTEVAAGMPLRWTPEDEGAHNGAHHVGWIDTAVRDDKGQIVSSGPFFDPNFGEFLARAGKTGVSIDMDDEKYDVIIPEEEMLDTGPTPGGSYPVLHEKKIFKTGRIRGATAVSLPAFASGYIELEEDEALVAAAAEGGGPAARTKQTSAPKGEAKKSGTKKGPAKGKRSGGTQGGKAGRDGDSDGVKDERANRGKGPAKKSADAKPTKKSETAKSKDKPKAEEDPKLSKQEKVKNLVGAILTALDEVLDQLSGPQVKALIENIKANAEAFIDGAENADRSGNKGGGKGKGKGGDSGSTKKGEAKETSDTKNTDTGKDSSGSGGTDNSREGLPAGAAGIIEGVKELLKNQGKNMDPASRDKLQSAVDKLDSLTASVGPEDFATFAVASDEESTGTTHAGILLVAEDTGRWLMLQRALEEGDENGGMWEFPGGGLDDGESPEDGARREFAEEVGVPIPAGARVLGGVDSGIYRLHILATSAEADVLIDDRTEVNPDDPDGDLTEAVAWWTPEHLKEGGSHIRPEVAATDWDAVERVIGETITAAAAFTADAERGVGDGPDGQNGRRLPRGGKGPAKRNKTLLNADGSPKADQTGTKGRTGRGPGRPRAKSKKSSTVPEWRKKAGDRLRTAVPHAEGVELEDFKAALAALQDDDNQRAHDLAAKHNLDLGPVPTKASGGTEEFSFGEAFFEAFAAMFDISKMPKQLIAYWTKGEGAAKIGWGTPGDFDRCVRNLDDYTGKMAANGTCANLHKIATGVWPGQEAAGATESFNLSKEGLAMADNTDAVDVPTDDFMKALDDLDEAIKMGGDPALVELVTKARGVLEEYVDYDESPEEEAAEPPAEEAATIADEPLALVAAAEDVVVEPGTDQAFPDDILGALKEHHKAILGLIEAAPDLAPEVQDFLDKTAAAVAESESAIDGLMADMVPAPEVAVMEADALVASAAPVAPPDEWFEPFDLDGPTPLTITADGRVYGHLTTWDSCHRAAEFQNQGVCVRPPSDPEAPFFQLGQVLTASGAFLDVGTLTVGGGHADRRKGLVAAIDHYDDVSTAGAAVRVHEDKYGVGLFGALVADASPAQVAALRRAPLSGDWRKERGKWRLVAAHAVNTPGYPVPRLGLVASGGGEDDLAFITEGRVERCGDCGEESLVAAVEFEVPAALRQMVDEVMQSEAQSLVASYAAEFDSAREEIQSNLLNQFKTQEG